MGTMYTNLDQREMRFIVVGGRVGGHGKTRDSGSSDLDGTGMVTEEDDVRFIVNMYARSGYAWETCAFP